MAKKLELSPIAQVLMTSLQLARITEQLVDPSFHKSLPAADFSRIHPDINTLVYLAEHYVESDKNYTSPMLQMSAAHKPLIEAILSKLFPLANVRPLNQVGETYQVLNDFIQGVQRLTDKANESKCVEEKAPEDEPEGEIKKKVSPPKRP